MMSCSEFAALLGRAAQEARSGIVEPTEALMVIVEDKAKSYIGSYQEGWAPLAETTLNGFMGFPGKIELGYAPPDNPLLRTGEMRNTIEHKSAPTAAGAEGVVYSEDHVALWQELGTSAGIPPRPFLSLALHKSTGEADELFGKFAEKILTFR